MSDVEANEESSNSCAGETGKVQGSLSQVYSANSETLFTRARAQNKTHALSVEWMFERSPWVPVFNLQDHDQLVVFYAGANVGIIYNHTLNTQHLLQGHCHCILTVCVSEDRRWIATADMHRKSTVMIWDSYSGIPVLTLFECHTKCNVVAMAFSSDNKHLVTLGDEECQSVCIWDWTNGPEKPLWSTILPCEYDFQTYIKFNPNDSSELLSGSENQVLFYSTAGGDLQHCSLELNKPTSNPPAAAHRLGDSVFHWSKPQVVIATTKGRVVAWNLNKDLAAQGDSKGNTSSAIQLQSHDLTVLTVTDSYFVTCDKEGHIRFYDGKFKFLHKYTDLHLDGIASISFTKECTEGYLESYLSTAPIPFMFRNFVVSTLSSKVVHVNAHKQVTQLLLHNDCEAISAVACHPKEPTVALGNEKGVLKVWDYNRKVLVWSQSFGSEYQIRCISFDPQGLYLAVGFNSGAVHIMDPITLQSDPKERFHYSKAAIQHITFSMDSKYCATADAGKAVTVFLLIPVEGLPSRWTYMGRYQSHYKPIVDLLFGVHLDSALPRLLSLGMDRKLVEYDLENSDTDKLLILSSQRTEQSAVPMCMTWHPPLSAERFLLVASDRYKMKLFNSTTKMCRKTLLGPTYDCPIKKMAVLPMSKDTQTNSYYLAFITDNKLGLQIFPLDGNPYKSNALICHPTGVTTFSCSYDGRFIFTAGGADCTALMWEINLNALDAAAALGGNDLNVFYNLLEGGRDGKFFREMEELFFFCQIRHQGTDLMDKWQMSDKIPLSEVPSVMRALGFFPTEQEIEDMLNEVKFSKYAETGKYVTDINLEEFIKLYVNHRPAFGISSDELVQAFHVLGDDDGTGQSILQRHELLEVLQARGEHMTEEEVAECFSTLLGLNEDDEDGDEEGGGNLESSLQSAIPAEISMETFTGQILGFTSSAQPRHTSPPPE